MKYHAGILHDWPQWANQFQVAVLAFTPGVPIEWIYAALKLGHRRRLKLRKMIDRCQQSDFVELGLENAASVVQGDGMKMLQAVCPGYSGAAPLWSQMELQNDQRTDGAIAAELGVSRQKVRRWRVNAVFDPLTSQRLIANRGVRIV